MIRLDDRVGSKELLPYFHSYGIQVELTRLEFGDVDWIGYGPGGECAVVVERKRIDDLIQSMTSHRLSGHQLPGMARNYDYGYLIVEGIWRGEGGEKIEVRAGGNWYPRSLPARAIHNYLMGLSLRAGMVVWVANSPKATVGFIVDQYKMWTEKRWEEHTAHEQVYAPAKVDPDRPGRTTGRMMSLDVREVPLIEKMLLQLPGVEGRARELGEKIGTLERMVQMTEGEWAEMTTKGKKVPRGEIRTRRRLGGKLGKRIWEEIHRI